MSDEHGRDEARPEADAAEAAEPEPARATLAEATRERDEYLDALQRLKAEFDNYRKRVAREQQRAAPRAPPSGSSSSLLPLLDDLERARRGCGRARRG